jgi:anti-sigma regulatory factor (Ser/Thr protein kinase)
MESVYGPQPERQRGVIEVTEAYPAPPSAQGQARRVRVFPGEPGQVRKVRAFVARALAGCPAREALLTCVSELAANAIAHTASGAGGVFTVEVVRPAPGVARVAVTDAGGPHEPAVCYPREPDDLDGLAESGRGLALVAACSSTWGYRDREEGEGRIVWAEATWPVPVGAVRLAPISDVRYRLTYGRG